MSNTLSIAADAEFDLMAAFKWYESRGRGLGHEFLRCVEARLNQIARMPQILRRRGPLHRLARIQRFPYGIYFIWQEQDAHVAVRRILYFAQDARNVLARSMKPATRSNPRGAFYVSNVNPVSCISPILATRYSMLTALRPCPSASENVSPPRSKRLASLGPRTSEQRLKVVGLPQISSFNY